LDGNNNAISIGNYSYFYDNEIPLCTFCRSGLLLPIDNASFLGEWYYNSQPVGDLEDCRSGDVFVADQQSSSDPGVLAIFNCNELNIQSEGLYTCMIWDADLMIHELKIGFYFNRGGNDKL